MRVLIRLTHSYKESRRMRPVASCWTSDFDAVRIALERDRCRREEEKEVADLQERFDSLTPREQEVISLAVSGLLNKQIAGQLGTAENTVKVHRSRAMEKMNAQSFADLVRMIEKLKGSAKKAS